MKNAFIFLILLALTNSHLFALAEDDLAKESIRKNQKTTELTVTPSRGLYYEGKTYQEQINDLANKADILELEKRITFKDDRAKFTPEFEFSKKRWKSILEGQRGLDQDQISISVKEGSSIKDSMKQFDFEKTVWRRGKIPYERGTDSALLRSAEVELKDLEKLIRIRDEVNRIMKVASSNGIKVNLPNGFLKKVVDSGNSIDELVISSGLFPKFCSASTDLARLKTIASVHSSAKPKELAKIGAKIEESAAKSAKLGSKLKPLFGLKCVAGIAGLWALGEIANDAEAAYIDPAAVSSISHSKSDFGFTESLHKVSDDHSELRLNEAPEASTGK